MNYHIFSQVVVRDRVYEKCLNALEQVKSRKGQPILICEENDEKTISFVPDHGQYIEVSTIDGSTFHCKMVHLRRQSMDVSISLIYGLSFSQQ